MLLLAFGIGLLVGRLTETTGRTTPAAHDAGAVSVSAADNRYGAVRASTRRLRLAVDLGGACVGDDETGGRIVKTGVRETPGLVRLVVSVRPGREPGGDGFCAGVGIHGFTEVTLPHPVGRRQIVNLAGTTSVQRVAFDAHRFDPRTDYRLRGRPVIALRSDRGGRSLRVVVRLNRDLIPGTKLQLDEGRAIAPVVLADPRRRCYVARVPADGDPERAPQLLDAQPGHHPTVSLILPNGRYLVSRPGVVTDDRKAAALIHGSRLLGALGCRAGG